MLNVYYENIKHKDKNKVIALSIIYVLIASAVIMFFDYSTTAIAVAASAALIATAMTANNYNKDDKEYYATSSNAYSTIIQNRHQIALHEAGHALVRMSFFPKSTEIDLMTRTHDEHGNVSLMNVNNFTDDEKKQLTKKFGITGYHAIEGYFTFAGQAAERFIDPERLTEPKFHGFDDIDLQIKKHDKAYLRKNMYAFLNDNFDILFEIQKMILTTDRKFVDYSDFGCLIHRIKNRELLTKLEKDV